MATQVSPSITRVIRAIQDDRASAVGPLLAVYFDRLVQLARTRLHDLPAMACYKEDVALRSFYSVYQRALPEVSYALYRKLHQKGPMEEGRAADPEEIAGRAGFALAVGHA
jgi:hypothetical protein